MSDISPAHGQDRDAILDVAAKSGLFGPDDLAFVADDFDGWLAAGPEDPRLWLVAKGAAAMVAPEPLSDNAWNMLFLAVLPDERRRGLGVAMVGAVEAAVRAHGARLLLIDTASGDDQAPARALYAKLGFGKVGDVPDYYGDGVARVSFAKRL